MTQRRGNKKNAGKHGAPEQAANAGPVEAESTDLENVGGGTPSSLLTEKAAKASVVNVLDHLSLSGYVSPLKKTTATADGFRAHPGKVNASKSTKNRGFDDDDDDDDKEEEEEIAVAKPKKRGRAAKMIAKAGADEETAAPRTAVKRKAAVTIDIGASFDPSGLEDRDEYKDAKVPQAATKAYAAAPNTAAKPSKTPKAVTRAPARPAIIGGLRMPLTAIQDPQRARAAVAEVVVGADAPGVGGKKKRRLLNQGAVPGSDTLPSSLLFGLGDGFKVPKLKH